MMMCLVCQSHHQLLETLRLMESGVVLFLHLPAAPLHLLVHRFFLFCVFCNVFLPPLCARACVRVCVLQELSGVASPLVTSRRGLDEMRGPSVRHQGRPSEIVRPTCNLAEISP